MRSAILVLALAACVLGQLHYWAHLPPEELRDALIEWDPAQQRQTQRVRFTFLKEGVERAL